MSAATSPTAGRVYGVQRMCAAWAFPRASYCVASASVRGAKESTRATVAGDKIGFFRKVSSFSLLPGASRSVG